MYPLGFTGLIECRLLNIFEPGVCPVWIMCGLINSVFEKGQVPESLAVGKMTLIDKNAPLLLVKDKGPLTVSSVLLSVITKILHGRLDPICEAEGYYGAVQYSFRLRQIAYSSC